MSIASIASSLNPSLAWSAGHGGKGRLRIKLPLDTRWYTEQPCTKFRSLEHRKEPRGFQHEFIILRLNDGSLCRIERMGDPDALADTISDQGSAAHDLIQCYRPDHDADGHLDTSELVTEVYFPEELDLMDVLLICRAIHEDEETQNYTLQTFNCYFFSLTIQCCLARLAAGWEAEFRCNTWLLLVREAIGSTNNTSPPRFIFQDQLPLVFRAYRILYPTDNWTPEELLHEVLRRFHFSLSHSPKVFLEELECVLNNELWYSNLDVAATELTKEKVIQAMSSVMEERLTSVVNADPKSLEYQCLVELIQLMSAAIIDDMHTECHLTRSRYRSLGKYTRNSESYKLKFDLQTPPSNSGTHPTRSSTKGRKIIQRSTMKDWLLVCWILARFLVQWVLCTVLDLWGIIIFSSSEVPCQSLVIEDRLEYSVAKLEQSGPFSTSDLEAFLQEIRCLQRNNDAVWRKHPCTFIYEAIKKRLPAFSAPHQEGGILQVKTKDQEGPGAVLVSDFQQHIQTRIETYARQIEQMRLASSAKKQTELLIKMSEVWTQIRSASGNCRVGGHFCSHPDRYHIPQPCQCMRGLNIACCRCWMLCYAHCS